MRRLKNFIFTTLIGGFIVLLPFTIFVVLAKSLIGFIKNILDPISILVKHEIPWETPEYFYDLLAFIIVISIFFSVGLFVKTRFGKNLFDFIEHTYLDKLPLYSSIKKTVQQFTGVKKMPFSEVVLVDAFSNGTKMTGFVTDKNDNGIYTVFVPTAPNPTNGFIFHVKESQIEHTPDVKTEDAMRTIIGVGVGTSKTFDLK